MFKNSGTNKIILIVSIITTGLWGLGRIINSVASIAGFNIRVANIIHDIVGKRKV
jgi:hypothetical protein